MKMLKRVQSWLSITHQELLAVAVVLGGLLVGTSVRILWTAADAAKLHSPLTASGEAQEHLARAEREEREEITRLIDSLVQAEQSTFSGTTPEGTSVAALAAADTVVKPASLFPTAAPKQKITSGTININTASLEELMRLPGVGKATAANIIAYRTEHKFRYIEEVLNVKGIGEKKFAAMKAFLSVK